MRIFTVILIVLFTLSGCGTTITVPIDKTSLEEEKATLIIYHDQGFTDEFKVFMDKQPIGFVTSETPLKLAVSPGSHEFYVEVGGPVIDRITTKTFENNSVNFMKIWLDLGMWVSSIRIDPAPEIDSYKVLSHRQP